MARAKRKVVVEVDLEPTARDYAMARLLAARTCLAGALAAVDEAAEYFVEPEDDEDGSERKELLESAIETAGAATRALEDAQEILPQVDPVECEPWDDDADDEDEDGGDDDEEEEIGEHTPSPKGWNTRKRGEH